jgi:hypothetical protein
VQHAGAAIEPTHALREPVVTTRFITGPVPQLSPPPTELTLDGPPVAPGGTEGRFLRAVLKEDGTILYRMKTRQRLGAKYLMKEVFD